MKLRHRIWVTQTLFKYLNKQEQIAARGKVKSLKIFLFKVKKYIFTIKDDSKGSYPTRNLWQYLGTLLINTFRRSLNSGENLQTCIGLRKPLERAFVANIFITACKARWCIQRLNLRQTWKKFKCWCFHDGHCLVWQANFYYCLGSRQRLVSPKRSIFVYIYDCQSSKTLRRIVVPVDRCFKKQNGFS